MREQQAEGGHRSGPGHAVAGHRLAALAMVLVSVLAASCSGGGARGGPRAAPATAPSTSTPAVTTPGSTLAWRSCGSPFQCATLAVPLDYSNPGAGTIRLALIRLPASQPSKRVGSLLVNPGGPGASGVAFVRQDYPLFSPALRAHFDIVGFDPRGVGASNPVTCENGKALGTYLGLDPAPQTPSQIATVVAATRRFDASCLADSGRALLANVSTLDAARDMDRIRIALGEAKLNYFGFSYGTFLGATYAGLFPTHIRAMALDGAIDPALTTQQLDLQQAKGFEVDLDDALAACQASPSCPLHQLADSSHVSVHQELDKALARIQAGPPLATSSGTRTLSEGGAYLGIVASLYSSSTWAQLDQGLAGVLQGHGGTLLALADAYNGRRPNGTYSNETAANTAINCLDSPVPPHLSTYEADAKTFAKAAPVFGPLLAWSPLACKYWPVPPSGSPHAITAKGAPPIVVVGTTADPATPYAGAVALAHQLASGVLITHVGVGHTGYVDSTCVQGAVDAYLIHLKVPKNGLVCRH